MTTEERAKDQARVKELVKAKMAGHHKPEDRLRVFLEDTLKNATDMMNEVQAGTMTFEDAQSYIAHLQSNINDVIASVVHGGSSKR